jgi:hypothetical protein
MFFVAGAGHCGTKWLSRVLTDPDQQIRCFHEYRNSFYKINWIKGIAEWNTNGFDGFNEYFKFMNHGESLGWKMGDSNSWTMELFADASRIAALETKVPLDNLIYLVRDGVLTLNSSIMHNRQTGGTNNLLRQVPSELTNYENLILKWQKDHNRELPVNLRRPYTPETLGKMREVVALIQWGEFHSQKNISAVEKLLGDRFVLARLEDLTTDVESLRAILSRFGVTKTDDEIRALQKNDVNRKIKNRNMDTILDGWDPELKSNFLTICSDTMKLHGYNETLEKVQKRTTT